METYTADSEGRIPVPGVQALYPPGTRVFYQNGEYAGHETPPEPVEERAETSATSETQPLAPVQVEPDEHPPVEQVEGN
jgi:hypothetical protein